MHILVIEDNDDDVLVVKGYLAGNEGEHCQVETAGSLSIGINILAQSKFEVVLLDLSLPDSQGLETFSRLQRHTGQTPVVILTGLDDKSLAIEAVRKGAQDYLIKSQLVGRLFVRALHYAIERNRLQASFQAKVEELETLNKVMLGREKRILELKEEIRQLRAEIQIKNPKKEILDSPSANVSKKEES